MTNSFKGNYGWAERVPFVPGTPGNEASVDLWFMHLPNQAVGNAWSEFMLGVIHLRPMEGVAPPKITKPGNTHELLVLSLQPGQTPATPLPWKYLLPANVTVQFRVSDDQRARLIAEDAAHACVDGHLLAESSIYMLEGEHKGKIMILKAVIDAWETAITVMAEHFETGGHHGAHN